MSLPDRETKSHTK